MRRIVICLAAGILCGAGIAAAQDSQSLGDIARQVRHQKEQKEAQAKGPSKTGGEQTAHVVTNENFPRGGSLSSSMADPEKPKAPDAPAHTENRDTQAEQWKSQIVQLKQSIASLQHEVDSVGNSIHFAGGNCIANCAQWNERQKQKQDEVETMKAQIADQQKSLEEMQETARKQGFGTTVYDP